MGRVYLGRSRSGRAVAVKVIRADLADNRDFRRRFAREVALARAVSGFFTAAVVDADPDGSPPWMATAYVPGMSLDDAVKEYGPWSEASVLALGVGLAEALESIHAAKVVHRDLKPSNVLLAADGPRVIDFGISVATEGSRLTQTGMAVGTPGFMSPEQMTGAPVGPASDVFCLGAVLAFTATGTGPFGRGSWQGLWYRTVNEEPDLTALSPKLRAVVARCLAKQPGHRPTVAALLDELTESVGDGRTIAEVFTQTIWLPEPVAQAVRTRIAPPWVTATPIAPAPTGTVSTPITTEQPDPQPGSSAQPTAPVSSDSSQAQQAPTVAGTPGHAAQPSMPGSGVPGQVTVLDLGVPHSPESRPADIPRRRALIALATIGAAAVGFTGWQLLGDKRQPGSSTTGDRRQLWSFTTGDAVSSDPAVTDGVVYVGSYDKNLYAVDAATGRKRWSFTTGSIVDSNAAVADGVVYIGSKDKNLYAVDAATGRQRWSFTTGDGVFSSPAVADGVVYVASFDKNLYAVDAATGRKRWSFTTGSAVASSPAVADGVVYVGSSDKNLYAVDAATGRKRWSFTTGNGVDSAPAVADGVVYVGSHDGKLYAVDAATGRKRWSFTTGNGVDSAPAVADGVV
ncbi:PQQ-binding-like beta-propeller repeat protein, partial [Sphaerisporangium sp. NPDC051011]|uniref:outer membrane protein assembly factor BamB family protein n=1 Tax=Sphaerisporangium sp. NPDC051011 TaxID=3155792 RepID=UPI0033D5C6FC